MMTSTTPHGWPAEAGTPRLDAKLPTVVVAEAVEFIADAARAEDRR
jgi:hypothetical protein